MRILTLISMRIIQHQLKSITMKRLLLTAAILSASGCASIVSDHTYPVAISGADHTPYKIKNEYGVPIASGYTPNMVTLDAHDGFFSGADYVAEVTSECGTSTTPINSSMDGWYIGNLLFGGIIGFLIIDPATGAMWKMPKTVVLNANCAAPLPLAEKTPKRPLSPVRKNDTF